MVYEYSCANCGENKEISKPAAQYNREEFCGECKHMLIKHFSCKIGLHQTKVQEKFFSHVHGHVVNGEIHEKKLAKEKGYIELGNERPEKHIKRRHQEYEI